MFALIALAIFPFVVWAYLIMDRWDRTALVIGLLVVIILPYLLVASDFDKFMRGGLILVGVVCINYLRVKGWPRP